MTNEEKLAIKRKMLEVVRVITQQGLVRGFGHVSVRIPKTDGYLITGQKYAPVRTMLGLTPEDILEGNFLGERLQGELTLPSEKFIHTCIYQVRPEVGAIVHAHPLYSMALSVAGQTVLPICTSGVVFAPRVPVYDDPNLIDTEERGRRLAEVLGSGPAVVLRGHGTVVVGRDLEEAAGLALGLEEIARVQLIALGAGQPLAISLEEMDPSFVNQVRQGGSARSLWAYHLEMSREGNKGGQITRRKGG